MGEKNLVLIGMMGCGKTTCGFLLSQQLGRTLIDMDEEIQKRAGCTISEIFSTQGEAAFRAMEAQLVRDLSQRRGLVIATGGGTILREENTAALRQNGIVIWLNRPADHIFDTENLSDRPLAQGGKEAFLKIFAEREEKYRRAAHIEIRDFSSPEFTVNAILQQINLFAP